MRKKQKNVTNNRDKNHLKEKNENNGINKGIKNSYYKIVQYVQRFKRKYEYEYQNERYFFKKKQIACLEVKNTIKLKTHRMG